MTRFCPIGPTGFNPGNIPRRGLSFMVMVMTGTATKRARVMIVDDHPLVREGLAARISSQADLEVCGEAADLESALDAIRRTKPDLVIVDISLKSGDGIELIKRIKAFDGHAKMLV